MSKGKAEIKALAITIGDVEVSLTIQQAKELHSALNEMFGAKQQPAPINIIERRYERYPWWPYSGPYWSTGASLTADSNRHQCGLSNTSLEVGGISSGIKFENLLLSGKSSE